MLPREYVYGMFEYKNFDEMLKWLNENEHHGYKYVYHYTFQEYVVIYLAKRLTRINT